MENALFISLTTIGVMALIGILLMMFNRVRGKDELDGLFKPKDRRKQ